MNFNTLLLRLGVNPDNFKNQEVNLIKTDTGYIYEVTRELDIRVCPACGSVHCVINDYNTVEINCTENSQITDLLRIKKTRYKCRDCNKTFTPEVDGIERYKKISAQNERLIIGEFFNIISFTDIAKRYCVTTSFVIQLFDKEIAYVPRAKMPTVLCIDEIKFKTEFSKYCCVLYDFNKSDIVDIIKSRQLPYLSEYFDEISEKERNNVKYFVSDMYDGYKTICKRYFKHALHIIDLFHVIRLLTTAINQLRYSLVKNKEKDSYHYRFMKSQWRQFICRRENIKDKFYTPVGLGKSIHYTDLVHECIVINQSLLEAYNILQDLYKYSNNHTSFMESLAFIDYISERLLLNKSEVIQSVGRSYRKWRIEIADGIAKNQTGKHYHNGIAEGINNNLKTITKVSYGYGNFDRFRKRSMIILSKKRSR